MALNKTNDENNLACLKAMCSQEDAIATCNYLKLSPNNIIDEKCRTAMVGWCQQIAMKLNLRPNTLWIAISFFDRYLSSGKGRSRAALRDKYVFQLAAITTFYIAVKLVSIPRKTFYFLKWICSLAWIIAFQYQVRVNHVFYSTTSILLQSSICCRSDRSYSSTEKITCKD